MHMLVTASVHLQPQRWSAYLLCPPKACLLSLPPLFHNPTQPLTLRLVLLLTHISCLVARPALYPTSPLRLTLSMLDRVIPHTLLALLLLRDPSPQVRQLCLPGLSGFSPWPLEPSVTLYSFRDHWQCRRIGTPHARPFQERVAQP